MFTRIERQLRAKARILKHATHLSALLLFMLLIALESRSTLIQIATCIGKGVYASFTRFVVQSIGSIIWQVWAYPSILLIQLLSLPFYSIGPIFFIIFRLIAGFSMYFFVYRYLDIALDPSKTSIRVLVSIIGGVIYIYFPYNVLGDNFNNIFFMRSLIPLYLLLLMEFLERKRASFFALSTVVLALMIFMDPRTLVFVLPIAFFFMILPKILLTPALKSKVQVLLVALGHITMAFLISAFSVLPRLEQDLIPSHVPVPLVRITFRYGFADLVNVLRGLDFEGTYMEYMLLKESFPPLVSMGLILLPLLTFSLVPLLCIRRSQGKVATYVAPPLAFILILFVFFARISGEPLIVRLIFAQPLIGLSEKFESLILIFRTPRFTNISLSLFYGIMVPCTLALSFKTFHKHYRKLISFTIITLCLFTIASSSLFFLVRGDLFRVGERTVAYEDLRIMFEQDVGFRKAVSVPYTDTPWSFPQPPVGMGHSVLRYYYAYALDPKITNSLLNRKQTQELANILAFGGIKYVIVDEYQSEQGPILLLLNQSSAFSYITHIGKLHIYIVNNVRDMVSVANPIFVLGGMETYRKILSILNGVITNTSFAPIFLDGPVSSSIVNLPAPIVSSPRKSILDLMAPFLIDNNRSIILAPAKYTRNFNPVNVWSPGYVSDPHHGIWTLVWPQAKGYEWEYSYRPEYGFAFTSGNDELTMKFSLPETGYYQVFVRALMHPENASIKTRIDNAEVAVNTGWSYEAVEFQWVSLGEFRLTEGQHVLRVLNEKGSNAINLIVLSPSNEVERIRQLVTSFYERVGEIKLVVAKLNDAQIDHDRGTASLSLNVMKEGIYSVLVMVVNNSDRVDKSIKLAVGARVYDTQILSYEPLLLLAGKVHLEAGQQPIKLFPIQSDISILVYGPQGSLADELMSQGTLGESKAKINYVHINSLDWNYREYDVSFTTNSSVMLVIPEIYTGTIRVSFDNSVGSVKYSTFPIYYVFTGIWLEVQETSQPQTFKVTLYKEESRSFIRSGETTLLIMGVIVIAGIATDLFILKKGEWVRSCSKKLLNKLQNKYSAVNRSSSTCTEELHPRKM